MKIDFLISPHYMPEWVYQVYPHLKQPREGFIKYSLFAPESLTVLREYLSVLLPALRRQPALLSLCLSNEPVNRGVARIAFASAGVAAMAPEPP